MILQLELARKILRDLLIFSFFVSLPALAASESDITGPLCTMAGTLKTVFLIAGGAMCSYGIIKAGGKTAAGDHEGPQDTKMAVIGAIIIGAGSFVLAYVLSLFKAGTSCTQLGA